MFLRSLVAVAWLATPQVIWQAIWLTAQPAHPALRRAPDATAARRLGATAACPIPTTSAPTSVRPPSPNYWRSMRCGSTRRRRPRPRSFGRLQSAHGACRRPSSSTTGRSLGLTSRSLAIATSSTRFGSGWRESRSGSMWQRQPRRRSSLARRSTSGRTIGAHAVAVLGTELDTTMYKIEGPLICPAKKTLSSSQGPPTLPLAGAWRPRRGSTRTIGSARNYLSRGLAVSPRRRIQVEINHQGAGNRTSSPVDSKTRSALSLPPVVM